MSFKIKDDVMTVFYQNNYTNYNSLNYDGVEYQLYNELVAEMTILTLDLSDYRVNNQQQNGGE